MKTTKRLFAMLLAVLMLLTLFPASALATEAEATEAYTVAPEVYTETIAPAYIAPEAHSIPAGWAPPSPPPLQKTISHWWPFLDINIDFNLWNIIGGNFPISVTLECNMFLALTQLYAMALITPGGGAGMTLNLTHDIVMPAMAPPAAVPAGATLYIRSSEPGVQRTITNLAFTEHFIVGPGATLVLEDVILCGGPESVFPGGSLMGAHHGGVRVEGRCLLLLQPVGGHLVMHRGSAIRNSNAVGNPIFRSRGGGVYLNSGSNTLFLPRSGGQLTMLPGSRIHNNVAARGGGVYASTNSIIRMAEGSRIDNNRAQSVGNIVNAYNTGTGGGIHLSSNAVLDMRGGSIDNNQAVYGGGVRLRGSNVANRAELHMTGGEIHNNRAIGSHSILTHPAMGGGIRACANSDITMTGGRIHSNTSANGGGGVSLGYKSLSTPGLISLGNRGARLNMTGGTIDNNRATTGGGVRVSAGALLSICNIRSPILELHGGTIANNRAQEGGGIWLQRNTRLCVDSRGGGGGRLLGWLFGSGSNASVPVIEGNHAYRRGGGIFAGAFTDAYLRAGTFRNNHAAQDGGAVFAQRFTYFTPVLTPGMYCDLKQVQSPTRFEGNTAGRGAFRPPVLNLRSLCLLFPFRSSATASPTFPPFMITAPNTLNNFDINFLGIPLAGGQTPTMATAYFMYNYDNVERESNIFDQDVVTIPPGTLEAPIEEPTRQGYQFLGWSLTEDGPTLVEFPTEVTTAMLCSRTVTTENNQTFTYQYLNLYAQWEPAYRWYRLSFIGNGGSPAYEVVWVNQYTTYEGAIAQWQYQTELEVPVREGYEFIAWALEEAPGEFALIGSHMYDFNVVENAEHHRWALFAQWRPIDPPPEPIQALFIGNGGSPGEILVYCYEEQVTYGCLIALWQYQTGLFEPTKVGYEFVGWSRSSVDEFPIVFPGSSVSGNILLFAQWRALTPPMMVTFIGNGGEPATITVFGDEIGTYGAAFQLWRDETGLQEPFKPGYAFQGWFHAPAGGEPVNLNSVLNNNQRAHTLYAQWEAIPVTAVEVVFLGNGGTPVLKTIVIDQEPTTYATAIEQWQYWAGKYVPTKEGHTFLGWARVTETGYEMVANTSALITGQNILAAQWERDAYITVTFNVTGGVPSLDPIVINHLPTTYGVAIEHWQYWARQDAPTRAGYTFQGWFHQPTGGTAVVPGSTLNRSITLYAQWERIPSIAVTFLGNGGLPVIETVVMNNTAATTYGAVITQWQYQTGLQAPTKEGHDFLGWARLTAAGPQLVVPGSALTEGTILVAQWRAVDAPITITFLGNGGRPIFEQVTIDLNVNQNPTYADAIFAWEQQTRLIAPTRQGHEFLHWSLTEDGGPVVGTLPVDAVGHAVLFAQWREVPGGIQEPVLMSFIGNGGTPAYRQVEINENTTFAAAISLWQAQNNQLEPSRPDFTFTHWSLYEEGPPISGSIRVMAAERFALFAQWAPVGGGDCTCDTPGCDCGVNCDCDANCDCASTEINVTFVGNEGIPGFTVVTIPVGAMYGLAITEWQAQTHLNVPTRAGHTFLGWSRVSAPGGALVTNTSTINANIILFAQWEEDEAEQITVTFHGNGGAPVREEVIVAEGATYGTAIAEWQYQTSLTVPTKTGYTFLHWSLDAAEGGVPVTDASTISRETNLYAQWEEDEAEQITVTFHGNGGAPVREEVTVAEGATYGTAIAEWQYQTSLTVPTKTGYTFLHWSLDAAEGGAPVTDASTISRETNLYAQWEAMDLGCDNPDCDCDVCDGDCECRPIVFNVYFVGNGGTPVQEVVTVEAGTTFGVAIAGWQAQTGMAVPVREGHTFRGWSLTSTTGSTLVGEAGVINASVALFAQWTPVDPVCDNPDCDCDVCDGNCECGPILTFNVLFSGNGGTPAVATVLFDADTTFGAAIAQWQTQTSMATPVREGYTFRGWSLVSTADGALVDEVGVVSTSIALFAQWTPVIPPGCNCGPVTGCDCGENCDCGANCECGDIQPVLHPAYMFGDNYGNFRPSGNITRAEVASILARTQALDFEQNVRRLPPGMTTFNVFTDVSPNNWFFFYVAWAYDLNLIQGYAGRFRPNDPITREELAAMIARLGVIHETGNLNARFPDAGNVSTWARRYVYTVAREELMLGNENGEFHPRRNITRAEVATAMNRKLARVANVADLNAAEVVSWYNARQFPDLREAAWYFPSVLAATNNHYLTRNAHGAIDWKQILP